VSLVDPSWRMLMMAQECMGTCYVPFGCGSACLGSWGSVRGMCNHVNNAKHRADMGRLSWVACCSPIFVDIHGRRTGCDFLNLDDRVCLSPSLGTRGGLCRMWLSQRWNLSVNVLQAKKCYERFCGDLLAVHLRKCTLGKMETLSHRRVMESPTCG
jgi:hypothetical protein